MKNIKRHLLFFCLTVAMAWWKVPLEAQTTDSFLRSLKHRIAMDIRPGWVVQDNPFFKGKNEAGKPIRSACSAHMKYGFQFGNDSAWGRLYPYTYQGIGLSYHYLGNQKEIGSPVSVYVYQGSRIAQLSSRLSIDYEWNFGASFGWKKYDEACNSYNGVVGSKMNAYINLGFLLNWQIAPQWNLTAGVDLTHFSNGNTHYPNSGVNLLGARIGIVRTLGEDTASSHSTTSQNGDSRNGETESAHQFSHSLMSYDLIVYGATRKRAMVNEEISSMIPGSFGIVGVNFNPMYRFNRFLRAGVSLDFQYDESANVVSHYAGGGSDDPKFFRPSFREQFSVGLSARAEWVMPIFSINLGIGYNVLQKGADTQGWYQVAVLKTFLTRRLFLHVGYQLSQFKNPNNLMLGMGWRF